MDEVYRGYRIATSQADDGWCARITNVRGPLAPFVARATGDEGAEACARRARALIDRYLDFLGTSGPDTAPEA